MIRHIVIAGLRNMAASKLLSAIAILGLAAGITVALLMALVVKSQLSYDSFLPDSERTYLAVSPPHPLYMSILWMQEADYRLAEHAKHLPGVEAATRLVMTNPDRPLKLQRGNVTGWEQLYYADPDAFAVLRLPVLAGELATALNRPDGMVVTRATARKYFGRDDVVGRTLDLCTYASFNAEAMACRPMVVRAVIHDLPANATNLKSGIFVSGLAPHSALPSASTPFAQAISNNVFTLIYLRLAPQADAAAVERRLTDFLAPFKMDTVSTRTSLVPLNRLPLHEQFQPGARQRLAILGLTGALVLLVGAINFINLGVARAARREREVGVRKACGADRATLMFQFLGEAVMATLLASLAALAVAESLLPAMNRFLETGASLDYPGMVWPLAGGVIAIGVLAGAYPAFLLSAFRPAAVLKGRACGAERGDVLRNLLVALQFAVLVVLAISTIVIWRQRDFALHDALRVDTDQMLVLRLNAADAPAKGPREKLTCKAVLENQLRKLAGVRGVACSGVGLFENRGRFLWDEGDVKFAIASPAASPDIFALYGLKPLAGDLYATGTIINLAAARMMGFPTPQAALGKSWFPGKPNAPWLQRTGREYTIITAVVPDFAFFVRQAIEPSMYSQWGAVQPGRLLHVKLNGRQIPETLAAIDRIWNEVGMQGPMDRVFLNDYMEQAYRDVTRQAQLFGLFSGVAILLACMGLVGIAVTSAERRIKEIGIRKAMGARTWQVAALLLWQFSLPVLLANLLAWPVAYWAMQRWLAGFAYRIELQWWMFAAASGAALLLALLTVAGQAIQTARQKPVRVRATDDPALSDRRLAQHGSQQADLDHRNPGPGYRHRRFIADGGRDPQPAELRSFHSQS
jgi:putative ABC transport system permease protein